ncbi:MAG: hypothetical protein RIQ82_556 [Bacteroidota bacterium]|jgi:hypothetical protein
MDRSLESAQGHDFLEFYLVYSKGNFFKANHLKFLLLRNNEIFFVAKNQFMVKTID